MAELQLMTIAVMTTMLVCLSIILNHSGHTTGKFFISEAQIDALLKGLDDLIDTIPDTSILSGSNLASHLIQQKVSIMSSVNIYRLSHFLSLNSADGL